jgi:aminopeptidase N
VLGRRAVLALLPLLLVATVAAQAGSGPASGGGDPFFPGAGNGGYDVRHYDVRLAYLPPRSLPGRGRLGPSTASIDAVATARLPSLSLDLVGLRVDRVEVDGRRARFRREGRELEVVPSAPIEAGARFETTVRYRGAPRPLTDPDGSEEGWLPGHSGGAVAVGEPIGTATWLPCNNEPSDKATFSLRIAVPERGLGRRLRAVSNGRLAGVDRRGRRAVWHWVASRPMATYLATVAIGDFRVEKRRAGGVPAWFAIDAGLLRRGPATRSLLRRGIRAVGPALRFFGRLYGRYPFEAAGTTVVDGPGAKLEYALETQTRPTFPGPPRRSLIVHELAHQWFGNSVTPRIWPDIWLNEGFATYSEWLFRERHGGPSARSVFAKLRRRPPSERFWNPPPGRVPGPRELFAGSVYVRGAMTLEALRLEVGDGIFFGILRGWAQRNRYGNVSTAEFAEFAERRAGRQLDALFDRWLLEPGKPGGGAGAGAPARVAARR